MDKAEFIHKMEEWATACATAGVTGEIAQVDQAAEMKRDLITEIDRLYEQDE